MRKKIIGIFVCMLMIATVVPVSGTLQESEQKSSAVNQNNNSEPLFAFYFFIGFITNRTDMGNYYSFNAVFLLRITNVKDIPNRIIQLYHSHEWYLIWKDGIGLIGKHFVFYLII